MDVAPAFGTSVLMFVVMAVESKAIRSSKQMDLKVERILKETKIGGMLYS